MRSPVKHRPDMQLGVIADDLTGATDLASVLRRAGWTVLQTIGVPRITLPPADAVVVSLKTRTAPRSRATAASVGAARFLRGARAGQLYFKYCSTFDSTAKGNIGPVIEALLDEVRDTFTIACPAYPLHRRTVYGGYLFVDDVLLSESSMRHHPLTPMTDSNLVRVLGQQCSRPVGLVPLADVEGGPDACRHRLRALRDEGHVAAIVDSITDGQISVVARASVDLPLVTGGAALSGALARVRGGAPRRTDPTVHTQYQHPKGPVAMLSGSCSPATRAQVDRARTVIPSAAIDPVALAVDEAAVDTLIDWARNQLREDGFLIHSTAASMASGAAPAPVQRARGRPGRTDIANLIEQAFSRIARALADAGVRTFVVAGGETAGAVVQALGIGVITFGEEIDPGVPWTYSLDPPGYSCALKSGNFGTPDFFLKVMGAVHERSTLS